MKMSSTTQRCALAASVATVALLMGRLAPQATPQASSATTFADDSIDAWFASAPQLAAEASMAARESIAEAAYGRRPALWRGCAADWGAVRSWPGGESLRALLPWVAARALPGTEFVLSEPQRGSKPLLHEAPSWESMHHGLYNVSPASLLLGTGAQSLYYSGTVGGVNTAHWQTEALLEELAPRDFLLLDDVPPPPEGREAPTSTPNGESPRNATSLRLWMSSAGVLSRTHYDKSHNVFVHLHGRKHLLLWRPESLPRLHLYPAVHAAYRQSQVPLRADARARVEPGRFPLAPTMLGGTVVAASTRPSADGLGTSATAGTAGSDGAMLPTADPTGVELEPGDCLYIPPYWGHAVLSATASVSIASFSTSWEQARWSTIASMPAPLGRFAASRCSRARGASLAAIAFLRALPPVVSASPSRFIRLAHDSRFAPLYGPAAEHPLELSARPTAQPAQSDLEGLHACLATLPAASSAEADPGLRVRLSDFGARAAALLTEPDPTWGRTFGPGVAAELAADYLEELAGWAGGAEDARQLVQALAAAPADSWLFTFFHD